MGDSEVEVNNNNNNNNNDYADVSHGLKSEILLVMMIN